MQTCYGHTLYWQFASMGNAMKLQIRKAVREREAVPETVEREVDALPFFQKVLVFPGLHVGASKTR